MKEVNMKKHFLPLLALLLCLCCMPFAEAAGSTVIVALGDSYTSGEGNEPYYGQDLPMEERCLNQDWLAHRSEINWPGMLTLPAVDGPMKDHRGTNWFFASASGATSEHMFLLTDEEKAAGMSAEQEKKYNRDGVSGATMLVPQLDIFDELDAKGLKADYVLLTVGGNDIGFPTLVTMGITGGLAYQPGNTPEEKAASLFQTWYTDKDIRANITRALSDIAARAGSQACIILAGYPQLLTGEGSEGGFSAESSQIMNAAGNLMEEELRSIVEECREKGINIHFVSVAEAFEGHEAYSDDPYVNPVTIGAGPQDLNSFSMVNMLSMHPNKKGVEAYARCVQALIDELEAE